MLFPVLSFLSFQEGFFSFTDANSDFFSEMQSRTKSNQKIRDLAKGSENNQMMLENELNKKVSYETQISIRYVSLY